MADNDMSNPLDTAETKEPIKRKRRKRGTGDIVCITLRLSHAQWRNAHNLALSEVFQLINWLSTGLTFY